MIMRDESNELIDQSGQSWRLNKETNVANFDNSHLIEKIDKILRSKKFVKVLNAPLSQHGYANTLLLSAFNQLERKEAWIESVAVTAHFQVERHDKKPIISLKSLQQIRW